MRLWVDTSVPGVPEVDQQQTPIGGTLYWAKCGVPLNDDGNYDDDGDDDATEIFRPVCHSKDSCTAKTMDLKKYRRKYL